MPPVDRIYYIRHIFHRRLARGEEIRFTLKNIVKN